MIQLTQRPKILDNTWMEYRHQAEDLLEKIDSNEEIRIQILAEHIQDICINKYEGYLQGYDDGYDHGYDQGYINVKEACDAVHEEYKHKVAKLTQELEQSKGAVNSLERPLDEKLV